MPLARASSDQLPAAPAPGVLIDAYVAYMARTGNRTDSRYRHAAQRFLERWPDPVDWAAEPLVVRRQAQKRTRTLVTFLMLHGYLRFLYDYLLDVTLLSLWRKLPESPLYGDLERFRTAARELGFTEAVSKACSCMIAARLLIQTGRALAELTEQDIASFEAALRERRAQTRRRIAHYERLLFSTRSVLYHLGVLSQPPAYPPASEAQSYEQRLVRWGVSDQLRPTFVAYLEHLRATLAPSTVCGRATHLGQFGAHLTRLDPGLRSVAALDRRRHIETYLTAVASARSQRSGRLISIEERRTRIITAQPRQPASRPSRRTSCATPTQLR